MCWPAEAGSAHVLLEMLFDLPSTVSGEPDFHCEVCGFDPKACGIRVLMAGYCLYLFL